MKPITALIGGLALLLVVAAAAPSTTSAANATDYTPQALPSPLLQSGSMVEFCYWDYIPVPGTTGQYQEVEICDYYCPGDEPNEPIRVSMLLGPTTLSEATGPLEELEYDGWPFAYDPCRPWLPPCEVNPDFPICLTPTPTPTPTETPTETPTPTPTPTDTPTEVPTEEPTEEPTQEAPPPAQTGGAGLAGGSTSTAWTLVAMTLLASAGLGAGAFAAVRRR